jgi:hypothetical protein
MRGSWRSRARLADRVPSDVGADHLVGDLGETMGPAAFAAADPERARDLEAGGEPVGGVHLLALVGLRRAERIVAQEEILEVGTREQPALRQGPPHGWQIGQAMEHDAHGCSPDAVRPGRGHDRDVARNQPPIGSLRGRDSTTDRPRRQPKSLPRRVPAGTRRPAAEPARGGGHGRAAQPWSMRRRVSTSSFSTASVARSSSILRIACITVV